MEKQKVRAYVELADVTPSSTNLHWRIHIVPVTEKRLTVVNFDEYWVVCGKNPKDAVKRFESFSNYNVEMFAF